MKLRAESRASRFRLFLFAAFALLAPGAGLVRAQDPPNQVRQDQPEFDQRQTTAAIESLRSSSLEQNIPLTVDQKYELELQQIQEITVDGLQNFLVIDPSVASVRQVGPDKDHLFIQGLSLGLTYVHLWTNEGRKTIQVRVVSTLSRKKEEFRMSRVRRTFQLEQSLSGDVQDIKREDTPGDFLTHNQYYSLLAQGQAGFAQNRTTFRYRDHDGVGHINYLQTEFSNPRFGAAQAGDVTQEVSRLTLPLFFYQGLYLHSPNDLPLRVDMLGGYANRQLWGERNLFEPETTTPFGGARVSLRPVKSFEVFAAGSRGQSALYPEREENRGAGGELHTAHWLARGEAAESVDGKAWYGTLEHRERHWDVLLEQRNVDGDYLTIGGNPWARGQNGQSGAVSFDYGILSFFNLRYDQFRTSYQMSDSHPMSLNREWRGQAKIDARNGVQILQDVSVQDFPGVLGPYRLDFYKTILAKFYPFGEPYISFRRESTVYYEQPERDYGETGLGWGYKTTPYEWLAYLVSMESVASQQLSTGREKMLLKFYTEARLSGSLWRNFEHLLILAYRNETQRFNEDERLVSVQLRNDYFVGQEFRIYVLAEYDGNFASVQPTHSFTARSGLQWNTSFGFTRSPSRVVKGSVFQDLNGDGARESNEPGVAGMTVVLNDRDSVVTDADGNFRFPARRGDLSVRLAQTEKLGPLRLTGSNPQVFPAFGAPGRTVEALFGIAHTGQIGASVYLDLNGNGKLDPDDRPVQKAVVALDPGQPTGQNAATDLSGQLQFSSVQPGARQVQLDVLSLPPDMVAVTPSNLTVSLSEGERQEVVFLIRPARFISGIVYRDRNANGRPDEGEGVPGAVVTAGPASSRTDSDGRFALSDFGSGKLVVDVDRSSLRGLKPARELPQTFDVPADRPFVQRDFDIPIH